MDTEELLDNVKSPSFPEIKSIKTFDISTLYTTIPHVKNRIRDIIHNAFQHKNDSIRYKFITLGYHTAYFVNSEQKGKTCYSEEQVTSLLEFLIDNIFVEF